MLSSLDDLDWLGGMHPAAARIIAELQLAPLPSEGGFFRRQWLSAQHDAAGRPAAGLIWFLVTAEGFSAWHRVDADERWEFHAGDAIEHVQLDPPSGIARVTLLGHAAGGDASGPAFQRSLVVPAHAWQGARLAPAPAPAPAPASAFAFAFAFASAPLGSRGWALLSCTMTPAWEEKGFLLGERAALSREFPAATAWIRALTR